MRRTAPAHCHGFAPPPHPVIQVGFIAPVYSGSTSVLSKLNSAACIGRAAPRPSSRHEYTSNRRGPQRGARRTSRTVPGPHDAHASADRLEFGAGPTFRADFGSGGFRDALRVPRGPGLPAPGDARRLRRDAQGAVVARCHRLPASPRVVRLRHHDGAADRHRERAGRDHQPVHAIPRQPGRDRGGGPAADLPAGPVRHPADVRDVPAVDALGTRTRARAGMGTAAGGEHRDLGRGDARSADLVPSGTDGGHRLVDADGGHRLVQPVRMAADLGHRTVAGDGSSAGERIAAEGHAARPDAARAARRHVPAVATCRRADPVRCRCQRRAGECESPDRQVGPGSAAASERVRAGGADRCGRSGHRTARAAGLSVAPGAQFSAGVQCTSGVLPAGAGLCR